jgi:hypothetical protein
VINPNTLDTGSGCIEAQMAYELRSNETHQRLSGFLIDFLNFNRRTTGWQFKEHAAYQGRCRRLQTISKPMIQQMSTTGTHWGRYKASANQPCAACSE